MKLHREGNTIMLIAFVLLSAIGGVLFLLFGEHKIIFPSSVVVLVILFFLVVQFFRVPKRLIKHEALDVVCPADGKVVAIEEVEETEYFKDQRIQLSVFMSPLNVHVNWYPISGKVSYSKYHPGLYLVAWHPKSSTENERTTVVVRREDGKEVLFRQIAGAVARRIVCYAEEGADAKAAKEYGFIKFGSRIDLLLPLETEIKVKIGDKVKGIETILGTLK